MIRVWSDDVTAGLLDRHGARGATFVYEPSADERRAVSLTMPVRLASWDNAWGIHPIFEMNLPEGFLREKLRLTFAKAIGAFDDLDLLAVVGRSQIGRLRYTAADGRLDEEVPFQTVDEILRHRRDGDLFDYLIEHFARYSGIAGVQPKVMIRDEKNAAVLATKGDHRPPGIKGATHIVKFWDPAEYPHLAANEFFCLLAAEGAGLSVPRYRLSEDASALVIDRFDLRPDGTYKGLEDFCVLNAFGTADKYKGSYESNLFKRAKEFIPGETQHHQLRRLFTLFVLNAALRNGDAHLKNYALLYDDVTGTPRMADIYDIVTTTVYLPKDAMALTLDGTSSWPNAKQLTKLGTLRCGLTPKEAKTVFDQVAGGITDAMAGMRRYAADNLDFSEIAARMEAQWTLGLQQSLGIGNRVA